MLCCSLRIVMAHKNPVALIRKSKHARRMQSASLLDDVALSYWNALHGTVRALTCLACGADRGGR